MREGGSAEPVEPLGVTGVREEGSADLTEPPEVSSVTEGGRSIQWSHEE